MGCLSVVALISDLIIVRNANLIEVDGLSASAV